MSESNVQDHAEDLYSRFNEDTDVTLDEVEDILAEFYEYDVTGESAEQSAIDQLTAKHGIEEEELLSGGGGGERFVDIDDIDEDGEFVTVESEVVELWDSDSDAISQVGLLQDDTGRIKFKSWETSQVPLLTEGEAYRLEGVATDVSEQYGKSISLNAETDIQMMNDVEFDAPRSSDTLRGVLVDIQSGSGLIERCAVDGCTRVLDGGKCAEHNEVDGDYDLRIKGVLDTGEQTHRVVFNRELTEEMTTMTMEEGITMAQDALDTTVVAEEMKTRILLNTYDVTGSVSNEYVIAQDYEEVSDGPTEGEVEELLIRASSLTNSGGEDDQQDLSEV